MHVDTFGVPFPGPGSKRRLYMHACRWAHTLGPIAAGGPLYSPDTEDRSNQIPLLAYNHTLLPILSQKPPTCPRSRPFWGTSQQGPVICARAPIPAQKLIHSKIPHMSGCVIWWKLSAQRDECDVLKKTRFDDHPCLPNNCIVQMWSTTTLE